MPTNFVKTPAEEKSWEKAKHIVQSEYPEAKEGSEKFYKLSMGVYKKMNKIASGVEVVTKLKEEGVLSKIAYDKYMEDTQYLDIVKRLFTPEEEKTAGIQDMLKNPIVTDVAAGAAGSILGGLGLLGATYGTSALIKGLSRKRSELKRNDRLKDIMKFSPGLREMDPALLNQGMKDLEMLNPQYASSPLIAGSYLKALDHYGGLTPEQAKILKTDSDLQVISNIFGKGFDSGQKSIHNRLRTGTAPKDGGKPKDGAKDAFKGAEDKVAEFESAVNFFQKKANAFKEVLIGGGALAAGVGGLTLLGAGTNKLYNEVTRKKRLDNVRELNPSLRNADPKMLLNGMKTIERLNPEVSKDPLAAGGFLKNITKQKGVPVKTTRDLTDTSNYEKKENPFMTAGKAFGKNV